MALNLNEYFEKLIYLSTNIQTYSNLQIFATQWFSRLQKYFWKGALCLEKNFCSKGSRIAIVQLQGGGSTAGNHRKKDLDATITETFALKIATNYINISSVILHLIVAIIVSCCVQELHSFAAAAVQWPEKGQEVV